MGVYFAMYKRHSGLNGEFYTMPTKSNSEVGRYKIFRLYLQDYRVSVKQN